MDKGLFLFRETMSLQKNKFLQSLKKFGVKNNIPNISEKNAHFLAFLTKLKKPKKILEIGMANGYSTCWLAQSAQSYGGRVVTYEVGVPNIVLAKKNFEIMGLENIEIRENNFFDRPLEAAEKFDFIFVDGQKSDYDRFWEGVKNHLNPNGFIIFDDVLKFWEKTKNFQKIMETQKDFEWLVVPLDFEDKDGIMMVQHGKF